MNISQVVMVHISTIAMGLVVVFFGTLAPWYKTRTGTTLFLVKVAFFIILVLILMSYYDVSGTVVDVLRFIAYPLTTITAVSLLAVIIKVQIVGARRGVDADLFSKHPDTTPEPWDGVDRRKPPTDG